MSFKKPSDKDYGWKSSSSRRNSQEEKREEKSSVSLAQVAPPIKPMILMKPHSKPSSQHSQGDSTAAAPTPGAWHEVSSSPTAPLAPKLSFSIGNSSEKKSSTKTTDSKTKNSSKIPPSGISSSGESVSPKSASSGTQTSMKMIDSTFHWVEAGIDSLQDQSDFLVVGVIGLQGVGKSTIMSMLANNGKFQEGKNAIFREQTHDLKERGAHMTNGVEFTVTPDRMILLDTQPILSGSVLEQLIQDRKNADFSGNPSIQMQSLQLATFILTVCHVVIVVQDYFTDTNVYSFLKKAEMVKPPTPAPHDSNSSSSDRDRSTQLQPVVVFVHNKLEANMFSTRNICNMNSIIAAHTQYSSMHTTNHFSLLRSGLYPGLSTLVPSNNEANQFIFPHFSDVESEMEKLDLKKVVYDQSDQHFLALPPYSGHPSLDHLAQTFVKMVLSVPKHNITHQLLTEKSWFHYAARSWEAIKKSTGLTEFSRLITN